LLKAPSNLALDTAREGESTTSLGNLFHAKAIWRSSQSWDWEQYLPIPAMRWLTEEVTSLAGAEPGPTAAPGCGAQLSSGFPYTPSSRPLSAASRL